MNAELIKQALAKVGDPNTLINLVSRRVRQLNFGGGGLSRPLVVKPVNLGVADIALREIVEGKMGWEIQELAEVTWPVNRKHSRLRSGIKALPAAPPQFLNAVAA